MTENLNQYHEACQRQYASQEADRRDMSTKALGILTFGIALIGVALSFINYDTLASWSLVSLYIMAFSVFIMITVGLMVLIPRYWNQEFEIADIRELLNADHERFVLAMADAHKRAIERNWPRLSRNNRLIQIITILAAVETTAFIALYFLSKSGL